MTRNIIFILLASSALFLLNSCSNNTTVEFTSETDMEVKNKNLTITVYGHNSSIADVSATKVHVQSFEIDQVPFSVNLEIPDDAVAKIHPPIQHNDEAKFYLSFDWDSNNDGKEGQAGDISFDWDKQFPNIELGGSHSLPLRVIPADN